MQVFHQFCNLMSIDSITLLPGVAGWLCSLRTARPPADVSISSTPVSAMQLALVRLFNAEFANVFPSPVIGCIVRILNALFSALIDAPDVANRMATHLPDG